MQYQNIPQTPIRTLMIFYSVLSLALDAHEIHSLQYLGITDNVGALEDPKFLLSCSYYF